MGIQQVIDGMCLEVFIKGSILAPWRDTLSLEPRPKIA